jgi:TolA-binding protein
MATTVEQTMKTSGTPKTPATPAAAPDASAPRRLNPRALSIGAGVLLLAAVVAWVVVVSGKRKTEYSARALDQARAVAESGNFPAASAALQQIIQAYPGTEAAREAVITLNQVRLLNGQSELAAVNLREFLATQHDPQVLAAGNGLLGAALENSHRDLDAADAYKKAAAASETDYLKAEYMIEAGRAFRNAGKLAEAEAAYREVIQKYPKTTSVTEAEVRLAEMTRGKI